MSDKFLNEQGVKTLWGEADKKFVDAEQLETVVDTIFNSINNITVNNIKQDSGGNINLEVGGRNYIRNSEDPYIRLYSGTTATITKGIKVDEWQTDNAIRVTGKGGTNSLAFYIGNQTDTLSLAGKEYTHSVYVKNLGENPIKIGREEKNVIVNPGESTYACVTRLYPSAGFFQIHFYPDHTGADFDVVFWHPKIEIGNIATDWSPASEDKQDIFSGGTGQVIGFDIDGKATTVDIDGTQILRGTDSINEILTTSYADRNYGAWRSASGGTGKRSIIEIIDAPNPNIKKGFKFVIDNTEMMVSDIAQDNIPIQIGQTYSLSCYARGTGHLRLQYGYVSYISKSFELNTDNWKHCVFTFTARNDILGNNKSSIYFGASGITKANIEICGMKLESGLVATGWSPSPEDKQNIFIGNTGQIIGFNTSKKTQAVDIGGTQILKGTKELDIVSSNSKWSNGKWRTQDTGYTKITVNDCPDPNVTTGIRLVARNNTQNHLCQDEVPMISGKTYTLSVYARSIDGDNRLNMSMSSARQTNSFNITSNWEKYVITDISDERKNIYIGVNSGDPETFEICGIKLESGSVATDWTPAPEDKQDTIVGNAGQVVGFDADGNATAVSVGGRNLLVATKDFTDGKWKNEQNWVRDGSYLGFIVKKSISRWDGLSQYISVRNNETYTFSFWIKTSSDSEAAVYTSVSSSAPPITSPSYFLLDNTNGEWKRMSVSFKTISDGTLNVRIEKRFDIGSISICGLKLETGSVATDWSPAPEDLLQKNTIPIFGIPYTPRDLTQVHASEIANYSDAWQWVKARITAQNWDGINIGDYIPVTCSNGNKFNARVAGINIYKGWDTVEVKDHIDFISDSLWPTTFQMNVADFNNGINATKPNPWLCSNGYYFINSLSGNVPNSINNIPTTQAVNYTSSGIYYYLPEELKNVITEKRFYLPKRFSEDNLLTEDNAASWESMGKLWLPTEVEIAGAPIWGSNKYGAMCSVQYPLFANNANRVIDRKVLWTASAASANSEKFVVCTANGNVANYPASNSWSGLVCFRISA